MLLVGAEVRAQTGTTTTLSASPNPTGVFVLTDVTATVIAADGGAVSGGVTLSDGQTAVNASSLTNGVAHFQVQLHPAGTHNLSATYSGATGRYLPSTGLLNLAVLAAPGISLSVTPNPAGTTVPVRLSATLNAGSNPTGSVTFYDGPTQLGLAAVNGSGVATATFAFNTVGYHNLSAAYGGDSANRLVTSGTTQLSVYQLPPPTATSAGLLMTPNPTTIGATNVLTATVTTYASGPATGTVTFSDGAVVLGTASLSGGAASLYPILTTSGAHILSATFNGDPYHLPSTGAFTATVRPATTTSLTTSPNPAFVGQMVQLTSTVLASLPGTTPTGHVQFYDNNVLLFGVVLNASGINTVSYYPGTPGTHLLQAVYFSDGQFTNSVSTNVSQVVRSGGSSVVALSSSSATPLVTTPFTLSAVVTGSTPTGTVSFLELGTSIGTSPLINGTATRSLSYPVAGIHSITAMYSGDTNNQPSASQAVLVSAINPTTTVLASTLNPANLNQPFSLRATVSGDPTGSPTGNVRFMEGSTLLQTQTVYNGIATTSPPLSYPTSGSHTFTAVYSGGTADAPSSSNSIIQTVASIADTTTSLRSSVSPANTGQSVLLSVTVSGANPTGTVRLLDGATEVATTSLVSGSATFSRSYIDPGTHSFTAAYSGDGSNRTSTSAPLPEVIVASATATTLSSSANPIAYGQPLYLRAMVTGNSGNPLTGSVTFSDGATSLAVVPLLTGIAGFAPVLAGGVHTLSATYRGDPLHPASTSALITEVINQDNSRIFLNTTVNPAAVAQGVTLTVSVLGYGTPTGTVTFMDGSTSLGAQALSAGQASLTVSFSAAGDHALSANYAGDLQNSPSTATLSQVVTSSAAAPAEMTWRYGYDAEGNPAIITDPNGNITTNAYDALQRKVQTVQLPAVGGGQTPTIGIAYDGQDHVTAVTDPRNLVTRYGLNGLGDVQSQTSPDSGARSATYDSAGNLLTSTDARAKTTTYTYDALNRVKTIKYPTGTGTVLEYDGGSAPYPGSIGHLTKMTDESGVTTFVYDSLGRLLTRSALIGAKTLSVHYAWGNSGTGTGKPISMTLPSGALVNYGYDVTGRLSALTVNPPNGNGVGTSTGAFLPLLSNITYNADNNISGWTWADGAPYQRTYDNFGRLKSFPLGYVQGSGMAQGLIRTLAYDNAGRITGYTHRNNSAPQAVFDQAFGYDGLDRLTQQTTAAVTYGYAYDATGNRTALTLGAHTYANTVNATSNRLTVMQTAGTGGAPVNNNQTYTASGSLTADGTATYAYSDRGRMSTSTVGGSVTTYKYNGQEQRVSKTGGLTPTGAAYYAYDEEGKTIGEYDANLYPVAETVYIGATPAAVLKETGIAARSTIQISVGNVYADQIDTPRVITRNSDEAILWRWDSTEAFGNSLPSENPSGLGTYKYNQRMPGQIFDLETGNFYNWNRDYQSGAGRYVESDAVGLRGGINSYAYAAANPIIRIDPTGLFSPTEHIEITNTILGNDAGAFPGLAMLVALVDLRDHSQDTSNSFWHAMRDGTINQSVDDAKRLYYEYVRSSIKLCTIEGLARALHAVQDSAAGGHKDFQPWDGGRTPAHFPSAAHARADWFPDNSAKQEAIVKSKSVLEAYKEYCNCK